MNYLLNPNPIFEDFVVKSDKVSLINKHYLNYKNEVVFKATFNNLPYYDHIETSGLYTSLIYSYGADINKNFKESFHVVFPTFRKRINDTRGSFAIRIKDILDLKINGNKFNETLKTIKLNGFININTKMDNINISKKILCSNSFKGIIINYKLTNNSIENKDIIINNKNNVIDIDENYFDKRYQVNIYLSDNKHLINNQFLNFTLKSHETKEFDIVILCKYIDETIDENTKIDILNRKKFLKLINNNCKLITNNKILDTMFAFSKIRASESICLTKNGYMHSPGGGNYYAATWNNDQCEYAASFFAYLNYKIANEAMINCFNQYVNYMYTDTALVSSIIAEATSFWNGAGDRGDGSMYVYGLTRFLLTYGDKQLAQKFVDPIKWCIDYTLKQENEMGLYKSDSDELENRFESGDCNLATNTIFYQALIKANILFNELNIQNNYDILANKLKNNINKYFYKNGNCIYSFEETHLRSHVCYPLIMGIYEHSEDIVNTLLNEKILTDNGFKTIDNCETYWDRVTLMAIRGLFNAKKSNLAYDLLVKYSENRLLNDHVPYAIEAYPEGNQAHLSAESALYSRIYLEGILGFEPMGFNKFKLSLSIPDKLKSIQLINIRYNENIFDIDLVYKDGKYILKIEKLNIFTTLNNYEDILISIK